MYISQARTNPPPNRPRSNSTNRQQHNNNFFFFDIIVIRVGLAWGLGDYDTTTTTTQQQHFFFVPVGTRSKLVSRPELVVELIAAICDNNQDDFVVGESERVGSMEEW